MLATSIALLIVSVSPGTIISVPAGTQVIIPGKINWYCGDPVIPVPLTVQALVIRKRPEGVPDVVEVKLRDGTDRLGWVEEAKVVASSFVRRQEPTETRVTATDQAAEPKKANEQETKSYEVRVTAKRKPRRGHLPDLSGFDAVMADMYLGTMLSGYGGQGLNGGYYTGSRQPAGYYAGGVGSSHAGGHYINSNTGNHYQSRR